MPTPSGQWVAVGAGPYPGIVQNYAGAWSAERDRCHRSVYEEPDGRPTNCRMTVALTWISPWPSG